MAKAVVLAEKPSVARDIARVLGCNQKGNGYLEGSKYIVTWALGHLVTLADPEAYNKKYQQWNLEDLPMLPEKLQTVVIKQTSKQYHAVVTQMRRKDVDQIIIATDAGREGELVARLILKEGKISKPVKRLWISSVTDKAIKEGFASLQDGRKYENLYQSAFARSAADWYVGMNATRALTTKYNAQLSSGRVQTPTLAMIAIREDEINGFKPKTYYGLQAKASNILFTWRDAQSGSSQTYDKANIEQLFNTANGQALQVTSIEKKKKQTKASLLYDLTELQRDANKKYGFSAKETLGYMQALYERYKILTYPRTDSRYLSTDIVPTLKERVRACGRGSFANLGALVLKQPITIMKEAVNNSKVSDHHAIIPTEEIPNLAALSDKERKIYDLVVKRFFAVLLPPFEYEETTISAQIGKEQFVAKGKRVLQAGWKSAYKDEASDEQFLPEVTAKQSLHPVILLHTQGVTTPPARFTEGTLLSAMEKPAKYVQGIAPHLVKQLEESGGIGTVATRADIIDKLFASFVIEKRDQAIHITAKGRQLLDLAPTKLCSPVLTAQWEQKLTAIAKGQERPEQFLREIKAYATELVGEIKQSSKKFKHQNISGKSCPTCGKPMLEVNGKKGKLLVCSDRECGTRQNVSMVTNARCPECKKKLSLFGEGEGRIFVCTCGYREKLTAFEKRRAKESGTSAASKAEVQRYLNAKNKPQQPEKNTAFASAFAKLKDK